MLYVLRNARERLCPNYPRALFDRNLLGCRDAGEAIDLAAWPLNLQRVYASCITHPKMTPQVILRTEAAATSDFIDHPMCANLDLNATADPTPVRTLTQKPNADRTIHARSGIPQNCRHGVHVIDDEIHLT